MQHYEDSGSLLIHLGHQGHTGSVYLDVIRFQPASEKEMQAVENFFPGHTDIEQIDPDEAQVIIVLVPLGRFTANAPGWYNADEWEIQTFSEPFTTWGLRGRVPRTEQYQILVRK